RSSTKTITVKLLRHFEVRILSFELRHFHFVSTSLNVTISSVRHGGAPALQIARSQSTKHFPGLLPRVGTRRIRFFPSHVRDRANCRRFWEEHRRADLCNHAHAGDAPIGRVHLRVARRPVRTAHPPDEQHHFLFSHGIADGIFSKLHLAADFPCA